MDEKCILCHFWQFPEKDFSPCRNAFMYQNLYISKATHSGQNLYGGTDHEYRKYQEKGSDKNGCT